jgi:GNAT superfamily N-acetyltransferase
MYILTTFKDFLNEQISYKLDGDYIFYYMNSDKIGYVEYYYDEEAFSEHLPNYEKEFYIAMIEVYKEFRGNDYATQIINNIKEFAKEKGASIITLRVDYGMGSLSKRYPNKGLERLYLKNGFKYSFTEEEIENDDTKNLSAMYYILS